MGTVTVRRATVADADALAEVYRSAYRENRELGFPAKAESVSASTVSEWIREAQVYVATIEDDVVGGVRLEATDPDRVKLSRLGVQEQRKGDGIGSELVRYAEDEARDQGFSSIWLTTPGEHPYLPGFYRQRDYEETGDYPLEYREYDEIIMEKALA